MAPAGRSRGIPVLRSRPMATPSASPDPARGPSDALARELYWAAEEAARSGMPTPEVRDALHDLAARLRGDERAPIPRAEPYLASPSRWRRRLKALMFRGLRPLSRRYDRLLADLAELSAALADRLVRAEAEIEELRGRGDRADG